MLRNTQVPTRGWCLVVFAPHQIQKRAPYGRFGHTLDFCVPTERPKCFPVRLKSFGSVFSSFLSYILVLDVSWLSGGVSLRFGPLWAHFRSSEWVIILHLKSRTETPTVQTKEFRFSFFFFSLLYIGVGCVLVVWGGQPKVRAPSGLFRLIRVGHNKPRASSVGSQPKSKMGS